MRSRLYVIDVPPISWKRSMLDTRKEIRFFDGQAQDKLFIGLSMTKQHNNDKPFTNAIDFSTTFFMPMPKTKHSFKEGDVCVGRMDADNLLKFLFDTAVDAGLLSDDNIICSGTFKKIYSKHPRTEFIITEIK